MTEHNREKLNRLQHLLPEGTVAEGAWLEAHGYPRSLRQYYLDHGWLKKLARNAFSRPVGHITWQSVVYSLQSIMSYNVLVGSRSSLDLQGYTHYLELSGKQAIHLYATTRPPAWLSKIEIEDVCFASHKCTRLFPEKSNAPGKATTRHIWGHEHQPIMITSPERAVLELLDELPERESFHQVDMLFEGLTNLRPKTMQSLLVECKNIKVKRLFFWFAHRHNHAWLKHLDETAINLGSGKRSLVTGGKLDPQYLITVPESMHGNF